MSDASTSATVPTSTSYTVPLYQAIAQKLQAAENCDSGARKYPADDGYWRSMAASHRDAAIALVKEHMPHGAGIDSGVYLHLDSHTSRLVFVVPYHHMDGNGSYCGWCDYRVTVTPSLASLFNLHVREDDAALEAMRAEYAAEATSDGDEDAALDSAPESAADYIYDVIYAALVSQVDPYARATREAAAQGAAL